MLTPHLPGKQLGQRREPPDLRVRVTASDSDATPATRAAGRSAHQTDKPSPFAVAEESLLGGHDSVYIPRGPLQHHLKGAGIVECRGGEGSPSCPLEAVLGKLFRETEERD